MSKQEFLDLDEMTAFNGDVFDAQPVQQVVQPTPPQQAPAQQQFYAQPQTQQAAQPNPIQQIHQQQAQQAMDSLIQGFSGELGKSQAQLWNVAQQGAAGLPGFLKKMVQVGALAALAMWGDVVIEPVLHRPIAQTFISSTAPGDGNVYVFDPTKPFNEQHWSIQAKTKQAVNAILFAVAVLAIVFWEPTTPSGVALKYKFLLGLALVSASFTLF